jgi:hypothetical protein
MGDRNMAEKTKNAPEGTSMTDQNEAETQVPWHKVPRTRWGAIVTSTWLLGFGWWSLHCALPISGNEWGDWAGGMFAPVAFLWLVLGYFQQGEELRDNVRALHLQEKALQLQVKELKDSVEQQSKLVGASDRQAKLLEQSHNLALRAQVAEYQPRFSGFHFERFDREFRRVIVRLTNRGAPCINILVSTIQPPGTNSPMTTKLPDWDTGVDQSVVVAQVALEATEFVLEISYQDMLLVEQSQKFLVMVRTLAESHAPRIRVMGVSSNLPPT